MMSARKLVGCLSTLAVISLTTLLWAGSASAGVKVEVCHIPPGNPANFHTITISENALSAHLAHGDLAGGCGEFCESLCDDGNACTIDDCDAAGQCIHPPADCNDSNVCTADSCDAATGCEYAPLEGEICNVDDTDACTGPTGVCDANGACEATPVSGCCNTTSECDDVDENHCTIEECVANECQTTADVVCDSDACHVSVCSPATGECTPPQEIVCEEAECQVSQCDPQSGCYLVPIEGCCLSDAECDDGNNCTTDTCGGADGCSNEPCAAGDECNSLIDCEAGSCEPITEPVDCSDGNLCTVEACVEGLGCVSKEQVCPVGRVCNPDNGECEPDVSGGVACTASPPGLVLDSMDFAGTCPFSAVCVFEALDECRNELMDQSGCRFGNADAACSSALGSGACMTCMLQGDPGACDHCQTVIEGAAAANGCSGVRLEDCESTPR